MDAKKGTGLRFHTEFSSRLSLSLSPLTLKIQILECQLVISSVLIGVMIKNPTLLFSPCYWTFFCSVRLRVKIYQSYENWGGGSVFCDWSQYLSFPGMVRIRFIGRILDNPATQKPDPDIRLYPDPGYTAIAGYRISHFQPDIWPNFVGVWKSISKILYSFDNFQIRLLNL